jgi:DNA replication and repair protein RecF
MISISSSHLSWNLELVLKSNEYETFLSTQPQNGRRIGKIDNDPISSLAKFEEVLWMLWLVPSMNNIFIGPQSDRRSFFDHLVSGYDKAHKARLKKLSTLQKERLHVIFFRKDELWLNVLEEKIAMENVQIFKSRLGFIDCLHKVFDRYNSDFPRPKVQISGALEQICDTNSEENAILEISNILKGCRFDDVEKQSTSIGAQKTLWQVIHSATGLEASNCSTGEQKAFLISLIISVLKIYGESRSGVPVLLLDDLLVHLDKNYRQILIKELVSINVQTFFTGTDRYLFEDIFPLAQTYHVDKSICTCV